MNLAAEVTRLTEQNARLRTAAKRGHEPSLDGRTSRVFCTRCKAEAGAMPVDCPGRELRAEEQEALRKGTAQFVGGAWWMLP